jgi:hypothetical protein
MDQAEYKIFDAVLADAELNLNRQNTWHLVHIGPTTDAAKMWAYQIGGWAPAEGQF